MQSLHFRQFSSLLLDLAQTSSTVAAKQIGCGKLW